jgi:hypothetical protein
MNKFFEDNKNEKYHFWNWSSIIVKHRIGSSLTTKKQHTMLYPIIWSNVRKRTKGKTKDFMRKASPNEHIFSNCQPHRFRQNDYKLRTSDILLPPVEPVGSDPDPTRNRSDSGPGRLRVWKILLIGLEAKKFLYK